MGMLTEREVRLVVRKEIKQSYGHLSLREQKELEEGIISGIKSVFGGAKTAATAAGQAVKGAVGDAAKAVKGTVGDAAKAVKDMGGKALTSLKNKGEQLKKHAGETATRIADAYNSGKAEALEAEATNLERDARMLRFDADVIRGKVSQPAAGAAAAAPAPAAGAAPAAVAESVIRKLRKLERQRRRS